MQSNFLPFYRPRCRFLACGTRLGYSCYIHAAVRLTWWVPSEASRLHFYHPWLAKGGIAAEAKHDFHYMGDLWTEEHGREHFNVGLIFYRQPLTGCSKLPTCSETSVFTPFGPMRPYALSTQPKKRPYNQSRTISSIFQIYNSFSQPDKMSRPLS